MCLSRACLCADGGQAAASAAKSGGKETVKRVAGMQESEARMILGLTPKCGEAEVAAAYEKLTGMNDASKGGSKYLTEKITNARDALVDAPPEEEEPKEESKKE